MDAGAPTGHAHVTAERPRQDAGLWNDVALVEVVRDGRLESAHRGHVAVADASGGVAGALGDAAVRCYPRSALKPAQATAVLSVTDGAGVVLDDRSIAISAASHEGSDDHQVQAAYLLAVADADESALRCPLDVPSGPGTASATDAPVRLAHNCSGKHAAFVVAQSLLGDPLEDYLVATGALQERVRAVTAALIGAEPEGPGVDGCGAPAWIVPLQALAVLFARAAGSRPDAPRHLGRLARVAAAMRAWPELVGGTGAHDTALMRSQPGVVAKRGAEAVFAAGVADSAAPGGAWGAAVKITDGGQRAAAPVVATLLAGLGTDLPAELRRSPVLGGGRPHGQVATRPEVRALGERVAVRHR